MTRSMMALLLIALAGCGGSGSTTSTAGATSTTATVTTTTVGSTSSTAPTGDVVDVFAEDFAFTPSVVTISVGDSVRWNLSSGSHTSTSGQGSADGLWNEVITEDTPVLVTFDEAGEFPYFCRFHSDFMTGRVVVEP